MHCLPAQERAWQCFFGIRLRLLTASSTHLHEHVLGLLPFELSAMGRLTTGLELAVEFLRAMAGCSIEIESASVS